MAKNIKVSIEFEHRDTVFVTTDPEQYPREVIAILFYENEILYRVSQNGEDVDFYGFQLSKVKNVLYGINVNDPES